ncbi:hypothetical protein WICPIJ_007134 [Wickerhamomyces pijperi]|uniref:Uncharacterized protein n=1 Tax=Wickerhamomyces pijperi TaxID=599730 RepID=A0A9P8Q0E1_WICPI|nr:hypothetical protein WICPIJ_007134 [Wickerhamomyces pijperi]
MFTISGFEFLDYYLHKVVSNKSHKSSTKKQQLVEESKFVSLVIITYNNSTRPTEDYNEQRIEQFATYKEEIMGAHVGERLMPIEIKFRLRSEE